MLRAKSDAEKIRLGKEVRPQRSDESRAIRAVEKIHAFPTLREIPKASMQLGEAGQREYDGWARSLFEAGRLTKLTQKWIESLALAEDAIAMISKQGRPVSASYIVQRNTALRALEAVDVDPSLTPKKPENSEFAHNGFPGRLQRR